jgi:hypothetical protein
MNDREWNNRGVILITHEFKGFLVRLFAMIYANVIGTPLQNVTGHFLIQIGYALRPFRMSFKIVSLETEAEILHM